MGRLHLSQDPGSLWTNADCSLPDSRIRYKEMPTAYSKRMFTLPALVGVVTYERLTRSQDPIKHYVTGSLCLRVSGPGCLHADRQR